VVFYVASLAPGAGPALCDRLAALLTDRPDAAIVVCDVSGIERPTPADLDHLARLRITARRMGRDLLLRGAGPRLRLLLTLTGLAEVLRCEAGGSGPGGAGGQPRREAP
jgi:anti-anti-sigma regulatory factor